MAHLIALFIDADNLSATFAPTILRLAEGRGTILQSRAYGDAVKCRGWDEVPMVRLIHAGTGKNASDLLLTIEAMEMSASHPQVEFVLASSDGDFRHLAMRLRERGHIVHGLGEAKTPDTFRKVCSGFTQLATAPVAVKVVASAVPKTLDEKIREEIGIHSKSGKGMPIVSLALAMRQKYGIEISKFPEKRWRPYLAARPALFELDP